MTIVPFGVILLPFDTHTKEDIYAGIAMDHQSNGMHTLALIFCVHQDRVDSVEHENGIRATEQWASHEPLHCLSHSHLLKPGNYTKPLDVHLHNTGFMYISSYLLLPYQCVQVVISSLTKHKSMDMRSQHNTVPLCVHLFLWYCLTWISRLGICFSFIPSFPLLSLSFYLYRIPNQILIVTRVQGGRTHAHRINYFFPGIAKI